MFSDEYNLERFVRAQEGVCPSALAEVRRGAKRSHWMWFILPQLAGFGRSEMAQRYAISGIDEARAYLAHPLCGARYLEIVTALQDIETSGPEAVFGPVDAQQSCSSLTLFVMASGEALFATALTRWCKHADQATNRALG